MRHFSKTFCDIHKIDYVGEQITVLGWFSIESIKIQVHTLCLSKRILIDYGIKKFNEKFKFTSEETLFTSTVWRHDSFSKFIQTEFCKCLNSQSFRALVQWHASASADHVFTEGELRVIVFKGRESCYWLSNCMHPFNFIDQISKF